MNTDILKGIGAFVLLLLAQALVLNHIHLFNCATPLLYVYIAMLFRRDFPRWAILVSCFTMGLCVDVFSNTPGVAAGAMTFIGLLQPYLLTLFLPRESPEDLTPSMNSLGIGKFSVYALIIVLIYCLSFFALEAFSFTDWLHWLECVGGSFVITSILVLVIEYFRCKI
ncbi:MAG: rod shape-determining protein MreD [Prevotella sp.]|nr:rod shape-determining protein MreD [Prevotella sp.]